MRNPPGEDHADKFLLISLPIFFEKKNLKVLTLNRGAIVINNASCLECGVVEKEMIRVGSLFYCCDCYPKIYSTEDPVREESDIFKEQLSKYRKQCCGLEGGEN